MLTYWAGLQKDVIALQLDQGAEVQRKMALQFQQQGRMDGSDNRLVMVQAGSLCCEVV